MPVLETGIICEIPVSSYLDGLPRLTLMDKTLNVVSVNTLAQRVYMTLLIVG